ncbi:MAG: orotidine-5'-phosphate decarboxylase [Gammaproteobacteria bacterium]|nr:orotidine-5'-phosphate decarboxylase [Gammaproteobacteria bacterium]
MSDPRVIVALDFPDRAAAESLAARLDPALCRVKVGQELFTAAGPELVQTLVHRGFGVFLDLKFHDIPNTVAGACRCAASLGVWMINVHALGGRSMLEAARRAIDTGPNRPLLVAVTVLTSVGGAELAEVGVASGTRDQVLRLARLGCSCGLDGVVCPVQEAALVRAESGPGFVLVSPGIRQAGAAADDQKRTASPAAAVAAGCDYLVVGRPVTRAADPLKALSDIDSEMRAAASRRAAKHI